MNVMNIFIKAKSLLLSPVYVFTVVRTQMRCENMLDVPDRQGDGKPLWGVTSRLFGWQFKKMKSRWWWGCGERDPAHRWREPPWERRVLENLKIETAAGSGNSPSEYTPGRHRHRKLGAVWSRTLSTAPLTAAEVQTRPRCPEAQEWVRQAWRPRTTGPPSASEKGGNAAICDDTHGPGGRCALRDPPGSGRQTPCDLTYPRDPDPSNR